MAFTLPAGNKPNAPFGLKPVRMLNGATYNGQTNTYAIDPQYPQPIFKGDAVTLYTIDDAVEPPPVINVLGFVKRWRLTTTVVGPEDGFLTPNIGVFQGCQYVNPAGETITSNFWPENNVVKAGTVPFAYVADDPNIVYQVQVSNSQTLANANFQFASLLQYRVGNIGNIPVSGTTPNITADPHSRGTPILNIGGPGDANNPLTLGNTTTGISNAYLDLDNRPQDPTAAPGTFSDTRSARYLILGIAPLPGNNFGTQVSTTVSPFTNNLFNIAEVIMIDHAAKVVPPYPFYRVV